MDGLANACYRRIASSKLPALAAHRVDWLSGQDPRLYGMTAAVEECESSAVNAASSCSVALHAPCVGGPCLAPLRCLLCPPSMHTVRLAGVAFAQLSPPRLRAYGVGGLGTGSVRYPAISEVASAPPQKWYVPFAVPGTCHPPYLACKLPHNRVCLHTAPAIVALQGGAIA